MRILLFFLYLLVISSCTVPVNFYLINTTNQNIKIMAKLKSKNLDSYNLRFQKGMPEIEFNLVKSLTNQLEPEEINGKYLYFELPPYSTFFVGNGANFKNFTFDEIQIEYKEKDRVLLNWENQELFEKGKSFGKRYYAWYIITED